MHFFVNQLLEWYALNRRDLPWRHTKNPYKIWISEVILQQTQVVQGLPYYQRFTQKYPTIKDLANADIQDILNLWQGLGYYSRARNMHSAAQAIMRIHEGTFPKSYEEILKLKGIGTYTAAAIASFSYNLPHAVLDGNVYRVLSRIYNIRTPINSTAGKKQFSTLAQELIPINNPGEYNQAIMELGALVCTPQPKCSECPVSEICASFKEQNQSELPVKLKAKAKRNRYFTYVCPDDGKKTVLKKRSARDIWQELYEFPLFESDHLMEPDEIREAYKLKPNQPITAFYEDKHILSHQNIFARLYHIRLEDIDDSDTVLWEDFDNYPIPRLIEKLADRIKE